MHKLLLSICCIQWCYAMEEENIAKLQASIAQLYLMNAEAKKVLEEKKLKDDPITFEEPLSTARTIDVEREVQREVHKLYYEIKELSAPDTKTEQQQKIAQPKKRWWRKRSKSEPHPKKNR